MSADPTKKLGSLLRRLRSEYPEPHAAPSVQPETPDGFDAAVHELVYSMLLWEASNAQARNALKRIRESVVDYNELRVCIADEVALVLGEKYPLALERSMRLRTTLNDLYQRHHCITLKHLAELPKREARQHLDGLAGCPCYVSARVALVQNLGHAMPLDERLRDLLIEEGVLEEGVAVEAAASWLEHHVKAEEALETFLLLQAWSDDKGHSPRRDRRPIMAAAPERPASSEARPPRAARAKPAAPRKSKARPRSGS